MRPIQRKYLPHTITLKRPGSINRYNKKLPGIETVINYVKCDFDYGIKTLVKGEEKRVDLLNIYFDAKNSSPNNVTFQKNDIIVYNNVEYTILTVAEMVARKKLHHLEIRCV